MGENKKKKSEWAWMPEKDEELFIECGTKAFSKADLQAINNGQGFKWKVFVPKWNELHPDRLATVEIFRSVKKRQFYKSQLGRWDLVVKHLLFRAGIIPDRPADLNHDKIANAGGNAAAWNPAHEEARRNLVISMQAKKQYEDAMKRESNQGDISLAQQLAEASGIYDLNADVVGVEPPSPDVLVELHPHMVDSVDSEGESKFDSTMSDLPVAKRNSPDKKSSFAEADAIGDAWEEDSRFIWIVPIHVIATKVYPDTSRAGVFRLWYELPHATDAEKQVFEASTNWNIRTSPAQIFSVSVILPKSLPTRYHVAMERSKSHFIKVVLSKDSDQDGGV